VTSGSRKSLTKYSFPFLNFSDFFLFSLFLRSHTHFITGRPLLGNVATVYFCPFLSLRKHRNRKFKKPSGIIHRTIRREFASSSSLWLPSFFFVHPTHVSLLIIEEVGCLLTCFQPSHLLRIYGRRRLRLLLLPDGHSVHSIIEPPTPRCPGSR